ncbi:HNH endonuclease signature motif containing protein [Mycolicibacterium grossiae]|uniref:HNH endonuclease signature motif containing protein n=2 Tax=Mycolicibacterium grossiae TaxID=1552759 RepID=UPI001FED0DC4|nr:HNH endonuclease signature motif containing protein [Mycolicibacterium grossiae]
MAEVAVARGVGERLRAQARLENAVCAARLSSMADLLDRAYAVSGSAAREQWRCDNWSSVCAQIGAAQCLTAGRASGFLTTAVTLRERLPKVGALFAEGSISYPLVRAICTRTALVTDAAAVRAIDAELAAEVAGWGATSVEQTERDIDALVLRHDPYAVRRTQDAARGTRVSVYTDTANGVAYVDATVDAADGAAFDARVDRLARTVCPRDPRTLDQRRGAALGALGFGWDRLPCLCEHPDCAAATRPAGGGVVIHVIAHADALDDTPRTPEPTPTPAPTPHPEPAPVPTGDLTTQRRGLSGPTPPMLSKPLSSYTLDGVIAEVSADPGQHTPASPGIILGGPVLPGPVIARLAKHATATPLTYPAQGPPEPRYRPSHALAAFIRARDLTCRAPGCARPATACEIDHVIAWPHGPTAAANLACLCTEHHLLKTFWPGWSYRLDPDGTATWTDPTGLTATTHPGSRHLFADLTTPAAPLTTKGTPPAKHTAGLTMPRRTHTRTQTRHQRIADERRRNTPWAEHYLRAQIPPF